MEEKTALNGWAQYISLSEQYIQKRPVYFPDPKKYKDKDEIARLLAQECSCKRKAKREISDLKKALCAAKKYKIKLDEIQIDILSIRGKINSYLLGKQKK